MLWHNSRNGFSNFWIGQYFWKFWPKKSKNMMFCQKTTFWAFFDIFWSKFSKILPILGEISSQRWLLQICSYQAQLWWEVCELNECTLAVYNIRLVRLLETTKTSLWLPGGQLNISGNNHTKLPTSKYHLGGDRPQKQHGWFLWIWAG